MNLFNILKKEEDKNDQEDEEESNINQKNVTYDASNIHLHNVNNYKQNFYQEKINFNENRRQRIQNYLV